MPKVNHYYPYEVKRELCELFNIPIFTEVLIQNIKSLYITNGKLKTWEHVCNVARVSGELAEIFKLDKDNRVNKALEVSLKHSALEYMKYMFENKLILYPHEWIKYSYRWLSETL